MENKILFGIKNVYVAKLTETDGVITYGTPFKMPGVGKNEVFYNISRICDNTLNIKNTAFCIWLHST